MAKNVFEIMAVNVSNFEKNTNLHMQQDKQTPNEIIKKQIKSHKCIITLLKSKKKKILNKGNQRETVHHIEEKQNDSRFSVSNHGSQKKLA